MIVSLGYAGWSAGQLEQEIAQNAWLTVAADPGVLFETPVEARLPGGDAPARHRFLAPVRRRRARMTRGADRASDEATVLAFDFGTRRIGVAVGNTLLRVARPLTTIAGEANAARFAAVAALIGEWQPGCWWSAARCTRTARSTR